MEKQGQTQQALDFAQPWVLIPGRCTWGTFEVSSHIRSLMMGTEMVPKMLVSFNHLTWLMA